MEISGKTAIVTGAASGIGLGIATALAEAGANVVMADIQKDAVEQAAHQLSGTNKQVLPVRIDVTQEQSVIDALAEAERRFGKLHIACNNAGVPMHGTRLVDVSVADWAFVIGVNVWGVIHGIRHFVPAILKHGEAGHIVNTASVAATQNRRGTNQGPYSMSKYAVLSLSEALEHELEGTNVGVTALCPGPIATNIALGSRNRPDHLGGPQVRPTDEAVLAERLARTGIDPKQVGERVVDAIRNKTFYAFVSAVPADVIKARHRRIEAALETSWTTSLDTVQLAAAQTDGQTSASSICEGVDLGLAPAARAANRMLVGRTCPTAAERWAVMRVESMMGISGDRPRAASSREQMLPYAAPSRSPQSLCDRRMGSVLGMAFAPATDALKNMQDAADHPTVVRQFLAAHISRKQRLDRLPLIVAEPEQVAPHLLCSLDRRESATILTATDLLGFNPSFYSGQA